MVVYVLRRLIGSIPIIFFGLTFTFFLIHLAPGDPAMRFISPTMASQLKDQITANYGLDKPLFVQYISWMSRVLGHFDFGRSFNSGRPAFDIISDALPATILTTGIALIFGLFLGIAGGIISAISHRGKIDRFVTVVTLFFYSIPTFWSGVMLLSLFSVKLNWLPASQLTSIFHDQLSPFDRLFDYIRHLILPVITLGLLSAAVFVRYLRTSMIEAMNSDYVIAARARGISEAKLIFNYGLRNALIPLISLAGMTIPILFSGAVIVEVVFSIPGMGRVMVDAVMARDYPVILAAGSLAFVSVIIGNLLADVGYAVADPRVRISK